MKLVSVQHDLNTFSNWKLFGPTSGTPGGNWWEHTYDDSGWSSGYDMDIGTLGGPAGGPRTNLNLPGTEPHAYLRLWLDDQIRSSDIDVFSDDGDDLYVNGSYIGSKGGGRATVTWTPTQAVWLDRYNDKILLALHWDDLPFGGDNDIDIRIYNTFVVPAV